MSIIGIGVDIVNNNRLKKLIKNKHFIQRIFTENEKKSSKNLKNKLNFYSKALPITTAEPSNLSIVCV